MIRLTLTLLCAIPALLAAQNLEISNLEVEDGQVSFMTFITASHSSREVYDLLVYSSIDQFSEPIDQEFQNLRPLEIYRLEFDANQQIGKHQGEVRFRFEVVASVFPIKMRSTRRDFRRGKKVDLAWYDHHATGNYDVELWRNDHLEQTLARGVTSTAGTFTIPKFLDKGDDYYLRIKTEDQELFNSDNIAVSIKGKHGLGMVLIPLLAVGGGVPLYLLLAGGEGSGEDGIADPPAHP